MPPKGSQKAGKEKENKSKGKEVTEKRPTDDSAEESKSDSPDSDQEAEKPKTKKKKLDTDTNNVGEPKAKISWKPKTSIKESLSGVDFSTKSPKAANGKEANFKIASWNVNGLKNWLEKDGVAYIQLEKPDVMCIQKLKGTDIPDDAEVEGYTTYWLPGNAESGVGLYYKIKPLKVTSGIGVEKHDKEGRVITAEFDKFYLVNAYFPSSGRGLEDLDYRVKEWDVDFRKYLKSLDQKKPVVLCGDLNVAHYEIDIRNPKGNKKTAGFTVEERESLTNTLREGFIDSFRHLHPHTENAFTYWTFMMNARAKNAGWRLDYFVVSERLKENLCDNIIRSQVMGSDHCPIVLQLAI